jgi:flagellar biosynthesis protein FlhG
MNQQIQHLQHQQGHESAQVVAISSGYSTTGKSSMALNLAICLSDMQKKVCVFDTNDTIPEQRLLFGRPSTLTMYDLIAGHVSVEDLIYEGPAGIKIIPQSTGIVEYSKLQPEHKQNLLLAITQLQHDYDFLMIDTAAGIDTSTISFLLGAGCIIITITPEANSLTDAFALLKGIKQRVFQQPVKVIVNLVAGELEAKLIIARLSITVRKYLGLQCGGLSFFIIDFHMLEVISQTSLVTLQYPDSIPSQCLNNIARRLAESVTTDSSLFTNQLAEVDSQLVNNDVLHNQESDSDHGWINQAIHAVYNDPLNQVDPIMHQLNDIWHQRKKMIAQNRSHPNVVELELLKLKTAIYFARQVDAEKSE